MESYESELIDRFVDLVPVLHYAMNRVLDYASPQFSRKVVIALWALNTSPQKDDLGRFATTANLVKTFREWFVVSEKSANSVVSKVKNELWVLGFIKIEGGNDRIRLSSKGESAVKDILTRAKDLLGLTVSALIVDEQTRLLDFALRMIESQGMRENPTMVSLGNNGSMEEPSSTRVRKGPATVTPDGEGDLDKSSLR